jgi:ATP synthase F1 delta subunit
MKEPQQIAERFIAYLKEQGQYENLSEIVDVLQKEAFRRQEIHLISAETLSESEQTDLKKTLTAKWGDHPLIFTVDPVLLSGMIIKFRDKIIDLSGKSKLTNLAQALK